MSILSSTYCYRLIGHASASFANLVQTGNSIEDILKTGKIKDYQTLEQSSSRAGGSTKKIFSNRRSEKNKKKVHAISRLVPRHQQSCLARSYLSTKRITFPTSIIP